MSDRGPKTSANVEMKLKTRRIRVMEGKEAISIFHNDETEDPDQKKDFDLTLHLLDTQTGRGEELECDAVVWATGAGAPLWLRNCDLPLDEQGFVIVSSTLQSPADWRVFAAGDCACFVSDADLASAAAPKERRGLPKAGVYAVREGPIVAENVLRLARALLFGAEDGQEARSVILEPYVPQTTFLALLNTCDGEAISSWHEKSSVAGWVMRLKDYIDRRFMDRFNAALLGPSPVPPR